LGWKGGQRKIFWPVLGVLIGTVWMLFRGIQATQHGNYLTTAVLVGWLAALWMALLAFAWVSWRPTSLRAGFEATGTTFKADIRMGTALSVAAAFFIPSAALFVVFAPQGRIDIPMSRGMQIFSPVLMACALFMIAGALISIIRRGGAGFLRLSPAGVENVNPKITTFVAWDDVSGITASAEKRTRKAIVLSRRDGPEEIIEGLTAYVPGGGLYWMIQHYWSHPDDRGELVDGRALERLSTGRFDVEQTEH
jgi:hypothetical protein